MEPQQRTTVPVRPSAHARLRALFAQIRVDRTFRFHLRCAVWIALIAAAATLFGALWLKFDAYDRMAEDQRGLIAETRRISSRLASFEARDAVDAGKVKEELLALGVRQEEISNRSDARSSKLPFAIDSVLPSVVEIVCIDNKNKETYYSGSGSIIDKSGLILTNHHLLISEDGSLIRLCGVGFTTEPRMPPRIRYAAAVEVIRKDTDLAILRITDDLEKRPLPAEFPALDLSASKSSASALGIGDPIYIAGYPGIGAETFTFTQGVVSGRVGTELIKTSALIDSGTSGGAVFDAHGAFVGVPTAAAHGEIGGSLGYLIGGETVDDFLTAYYGKKK